MEDRIEHERSEQRPNLPASTVGCVATVSPIPFNVIR
jgi:hypothetical protein